MRQSNDYMYSAPVEASSHRTCWPYRVHWGWCCAVVLLIICDQYMKYRVSHWLLPYQSHPLLPILNITLAYNTGAAFSFLETSGEWHRWILLSMSVIMSMVFMIWMYRLPRHATWWYLAFTLLLGGTLGNLYDRLFFGYVIDFIDFHYHQYHFAIFNVADSAICIGTGVLCWCWRDS